MKKWLTELATRFGRVVHELVAVKTIPFVLITVIYFQNASGFGMLGFITYSVIALAFVGVRYAEKRLDLLLKAKEMLK